jgi:hypothetical protein
MYLSLQSSLSSDRHISEFRQNEDAIVVCGESRDMNSDFGHLRRFGESDI